MSLADFTAHIVAHRLGIPCTVHALNNLISVAPTGIDANDGFSIQFQRHWRSAEASFVPGKFARPLLRKMGAVDSTGKTTFSALIRSLPPSVKAKCVVNGLSLDSSKPDGWPADWSSFELSLVRGSLPADDMTETDWQQVVADLVLPVFAMTIALIGVEDCDSEDVALEGEKTQRLSTSHERKKINRDICLQIHGRTCHCCDLVFAKVYGEIAEGFIEVHHIEPISQAGGPYKLNPATDLVPVCSNCHSVLHMTEPPMLPAELRLLVQSMRDHAKGS